MEKGLLEQVSITVTSENLEVEKLLYDKRKDPVAAAVCAYALLRLGELERLDDWTRNLRNWFKGLPDGIVIRAEHLARLGKHDHALTVLLELPLQGLPIFTDGLSYAINRLRLYVSLGESHFEKVKLFHAQDLLEQLQRFATFADFSRSILTFTGIIPGHPNDEPLPEDVDSYEGLNLADYLGSLEHQQQLGTHKENQLEPLSERYIIDVLVERVLAVMQLIKEPQVILGVLMTLYLISGPLPALTKPPEELSKQDLVQQFKIEESPLSETKDNKKLEKFMEAISELQRLILEKANELNELPLEEAEIENIARLESEIAELKAIEKRIEASREALSLLNPETQQEYLKALAEEAGDAALVAHPELKNPGGGADSIDNIQQFYFNIEDFLFLIYNCLIVCRPKLLDMALADEDNPLEPLPATAYVAAFKFIRDHKIADAIPSEAAKELTAYFDYLIEKLVSTT